MARGLKMYKFGYHLKIHIPENVRYLIDVLKEDGYKAYIVGGCIRDTLLHKQPNDWDICTSATPQEIIDLLDCYDDIEVILTGLKHGTITARLNGENYEITTYRIDGEYSDNRRPDSVIFVDDINKDLSRRDFTINAMAYSGGKHFDITRFVDPYGGWGDLHDGIIRCVGHPDDRFREDALRILRALRFASTYGFRIEEKTAAAIHRNKDLLKNISAERIQSELCKMLCGKGVLDILLEYKDVMTVIIPELEPCIGFNQNNPYHIYDVYDHIAHAVANYKGSDISIKMALLLHDIGKPECYSEDEKGGHFYGHAVPSMAIAKEVMERLKFDTKTQNEVISLVLSHDADIQPTTRPVKRWLSKIGYEMLEKLVLVKLADISAHSEINRSERICQYHEVHDTAFVITEEQQCFAIKDLAVNGHDIMSLGIPSGPAVGKVLKHLLDKVLDEELENERNVLMTEAAYYIAK
jgi:tRNA nucleotidyltransferase (CCA-adding enzyme)